MRRKLLAQDCLTTLIELDSTGKSAEIVGSMIDYLPIEEGNGALIKQMADPAIRIVSLTVTEGGYYIDPVTSGFDSDHPDMCHDAANPGRPRSAFGAMVEALRRRRELGLAPFTGLSCDNLQGNGLILRQTIVSLARMSNPDLADWIDANVAFPNSVVDCIVPATGPKEIALARELGVSDAAPVTHESFRQWVIEDDFRNGRPNWERVGVHFSDRVHDFEAMKLRILNAGHQVLANVGEIAGIETIAACMEHPVISAFFRKVQREEIAPHVQPVPGMTALDYISLIERRFSNPGIVDTTARVAFDGTSRHAVFVLPIVYDAIAKGAPVEGLALVEALWARMCHGTREDGRSIPPNDPNWDGLVAVAQLAREQPEAWLEQRALYGDLIESIVFRDAFVRWLGSIWRLGALPTLERYIQS